MIPCVAIVGVGLIGGSFSLALREAKAVGRVIGVGRLPENNAQALALGVVDEITDLVSAVAQADFVLVATPVGQMEAIFAELAPHLRANAVLTDAGSTKGDVVAAARRALGHRIAQFVPGHPVAGAEKSGAAAALAGLYQKRRVVLTALPENPPEVVARVAAAWQTCGAVVTQMSVAEHDQVLAAVSHLPHMLAYALVENIVADANADTLWQFAAGGFRDFSRIASSHPEMWRDISVANRAALLARIDSYSQTLADLRGLIEAGDAASLEAWFQRARDQRNAWLQRFEAGR